MPKLEEDSGWHYGWIEGIAGVNCQAETREDLVGVLTKELEERLKYPPEELLSTVPEYDYIPKPLVKMIVKDLNLNITEDQFEKLFDAEDNTGGASSKTSIKDPK